MERQLSNTIDAALQVIADAVRDVDGSKRWSVHLLIDPTLADPLSLLEAEGRERVRVSISRTLMSEAHCPYLVPVREVGRDPLIDAALDRAMCEVEGNSSVPPGARSVCAFIASRVSAIEIARSLARRAAVSSGGERRLFRFWDPRVMDLLPQFISFDEIRNLVAPVERWCWIARDGRAEVLELADASPASGPHRPLDPGRFMNFGRINKVIDSLNLDSASYRKIDCAKIDRDIRAGERRWRLQTEYEMVSYALHRHLVGDHFDDDDEVRHLMESAVQKGDSPIVALESLSEQFWASFSGRQGL
ncbi:DUF4123 domain-containing protein [Stenotrophomonas sp. GD04145]|uniref:DUF4123 domain-containing protein n=1 Tax=Stenotrophomonas sp. GD04145 TaxID=2975436 RepID=UPI00244888D9|nr:DUF4123 domain-containing protein [Stenotrophomonas sp. GD04145]MDH0170258.1 DUF4123 domain-containing protein [Stenotrophomonas sp. GD04145]